VIIFGTLSFPVVVFFKTDCNTWVVKVDEKIRHREIPCERGGPVELMRSSYRLYRLTSLLPISGRCLRSRRTVALLKVEIGEQCSVPTSLFFPHNFSKICIALINRFTAAKRARHSATFSSVLFSPFSTDIIRLHFHSILHGSRIFATIPSFAYLLKFLSLVSKKYIGVLCAESDAAMGCLSVCPSRAGIVRRNDCLFVTTRCTAKPNVSPPGSATSHSREENQFF